MASSNRRASVVSSASYPRRSTRRLRALRRGMTSLSNHRTFQDPAISPVVYFWEMTSLKPLHSPRKLRLK
jgi:hypothetical protein